MAEIMNKGAKIQQILLGALLMCFLATAHAADLAINQVFYDGDNTHSVTTIINGKPLEYHALFVLKRTGNSLVPF